MKVYRIPTLIHFFGPDGSGKSTHVDILLNLLKEQEPRVKKIWLRSPHTVAFLLWRLFIKVGFYRVVSNPFGDPVRLPAVNRKGSLRTLWALVEFFSVLPLIARIRFLMLRGYKCIAERYVLDTIVTVAYFIGDMNFLTSRISSLLFRFIPPDTLFIFLDSDYGTVFRRRAHLRGKKRLRRNDGNYGSLPRAAVEPQEFINFQRNAYKILSKSFHATEIDTSSRTIKETSNEIQKLLESQA
ncbi:MAG: hypothetical protein ABSB28_01685 [Candidatus Bathyarchaeia archaeon]